MVQNPNVPPFSLNSARRSKFVRGSFVATPELVSQFPELYHYTSEAGLRGILASGTLWATRYQDLSDKSEAFYIMDYVRELLIPQAAKIIYRYGPDTDERAAAEFLINIWLPHIWKGLMSDEELLIRTTPYMMSFCAPDDEYDRENGLLSLWRGYGGAGGYCIVFDSNELATLLASDTGTAMYSWLYLRRVHYGRGGALGAKILKSLVKKMTAEFKNQHLASSSYTDFLDDLIEVATTFKHPAFRDEREVRIVASPSPLEIADHMKMENPLVQLPRIIGEKTQSSPERSFRYIELLGTAHAKLAVKRILVGPSRDQSRLMQIAKDASGGSVEVSPSAIPFLP